MLQLLLDLCVKRRINLISPGADLRRLLAIDLRKLFLILLVLGSIRKGIFEYKALILHHLLGGAVHCIAHQIILRAGFLLHAHHLDLFLEGGVILLLCNISRLQHIAKHLFLLLSRQLFAGNGIIIVGAVGNAAQHGRLCQRDVLCRTAKIKLCRRLHPIALVAVIVTVAVKFHDLCLIKFLLQSRSQQQLRQLAAVGLFLGQKIVLNELLGNGTSPLGNLPIVCHQSDPRPGQRLQVNSRMLLKTLVLRGNVTVLDVHGYILYLDILIGSAVDLSNMFSILIIHLRVG